jgi:hypothetical protein
MSLQVCKFIVTGKALNEPQVTGIVAPPLPKSCINWLEAEQGDQKIDQKTPNFFKKWPKQSPN